MITKEVDLDNFAMTTNLYLCLSGYNEAEISKDITACLKLIKTFEKHFSRFLPESELSKLNKSSKKTKVSTDMLNMLKQSKNYHTLTNGVFDISILPVLINEGYAKSKTEGFVDQNAKVIKENNHKLSELKLFETTKQIEKPLDLKLDLGGIGKGYLIDKLVEKLNKKYTDFCISIGGDMYTAGGDVQNKYDYWAIELENPNNIDKEMPTLLVKNRAIATSGVNKRTWLHKGKIKNHLINKAKNASVQNNLSSVTVIADKAITADILAKSLLIMGLKEGLRFAKDRKIDAIFIDNSSTITYASNAYGYTWKNN